jgi:hypothetical protein
MFRQRQYTNRDNLLIERLNYLDDMNINYDNIKFWNINYKTWVDCDNLTNYKIQKEVQINNELIFYIYLEDYDAEE